MGPGEDGQDVMQVCRNGHVITDQLQRHPERGRTHCELCGAVTLEGCPTCGREIPGAIAVPGLEPVGSRRPPLYCATCGAAFPWAPRPASAPEPLMKVEGLLRRLPLVIRQLRVRQGERPPFRVQDEKDLEDLARALLPLHFDDIRPQGRTPRYDPGTRTDFLLAPERVVVVVKMVRSEVREAQLAGQLAEDAGHYGKQGNCEVVVCYVHDPEGLVRDPQGLALACARIEEGVGVRVVVGR